MLPVTRTAVVVIAHGRHDHWQNQWAALRRSDPAADDVVLVTMDDDDLAAVAREAGAVVVPIDRHPDGLPLARARNLGARTALERGADLLVFLDVDCVPAPGLVGAYAAAAREVPGHLLCGPVTYLDPPPPGGYDLARLDELDAPHPARPAPPPGAVETGGSHDLFWSLSFAVDAPTWELLGGFHEAYVGYGGEDTDFGRTARARGVEMAWVGSARAYHQHHAVERPPVRHLDDILRNARLFHDRWGAWPMTGWLDAFEADGLIERTPDGYRRVPAPTVARVESPGPQR